MKIIEVILNSEESDEEEEDSDELDELLDLDELSLLESFEYQPDPLKIIPAGTNTFLIRS